MNCHKVLCLFQTRPDVFELRKMFTPEQVRRWDEDLLNMCVYESFALTNWWTEVLQWMIEECSYSLKKPINFVFHPRSPFSMVRLRLLLRHGAVASNENGPEHVICGQSWDSNVYDVLKMFASYGHKPKGTTSYCSVGCYSTVYLELFECHRRAQRSVIAMLGARKKSPLMRQCVARELLLAMARAVWARRWDKIWSL